MKIEFQIESLWLMLPDGLGVCGIENAPDRVEFIEHAGLCWQPSISPAERC